MKKLFLPLFCLFLINCSKKESIANEPSRAMAMEVPQEDKLIAIDSAAVALPPPPSSVAETNSEPSQNSPQTTVISKKIIKNGDMRIQV